MDSRWIGGQLCFGGLGKVSFIVLGLLGQRLKKLLEKLFGRLFRLMYSFIINILDCKVMLSCVLLAFVFILILGVGRCKLWVGIRQAVWLQMIVFVLDSCIFIYKLVVLQFVVVVFNFFSLISVLLLVGIFRFFFFSYRCLLVRWQSLMFRCRCLF